MSTLPEITEALCKAVASGYAPHMRTYALQAAAKMGGERGDRVRAAFANEQQKALQYWTPVIETRSPWLPPKVLSEAAAWTAELAAADALAAAGERVLPLLLFGETRCGKSSLAASIARQMNLPAYRLSLASAVDSYMGGTTKLLDAALTEALSRPGLWLIDELDAVAGARTAGTEGAAAEGRRIVGALLARLDTLPAGLPLIATSNFGVAIDSAVLGRFRCVEWPCWDHIMIWQDEFFAAHGGERPASVHVSSYAQAVQLCRDQRVARILKANAEAAE